MLHVVSLSSTSPFYYQKHGSKLFLLKKNLFFVCSCVPSADMKDAKDQELSKCSLSSTFLLFHSIPPFMMSSQCIQSFNSYFLCSASFNDLTFDFIKSIDNDLNNLNAAECALLYMKIVKKLFYTRCVQAAPFSFACVLFNSAIFS